LSFADEIAPSAQRPLKIEDRIHERFGQAQEKKEAYRDRFIDLVSEYAPELLDDFESFWTDHDEIHTLLMAERERIAESKKAESMAFFESIKARVTSNEITREEAKMELEAFHAAERAERESVKAEFDALKDSMDVPQEVVKNLHDSLKDAEEAGDVETMKEILMELIGYQPQHLAFDQAKLELMMTK
jgi:hypothetical protein